MNRLLILVITVCLFATGCGTVVPPGKRVILIQPDGSTDIYDKGSYFAYGRTRVYFVDQQLSSFNEDDQRILCKDEVNMLVDVKAVLSFDVTESSLEFIQEKVKPVKNSDGNLELSLDAFYRMALQPIVLGTARNVISAMETDDIRPNRQKIENDLTQIVRQRIKDLNYPINVSAILLSSIDYPDSVTGMRERIKKAELEDQEKAAKAEAILAQAQREVAIETEQAKSRLVRAQAQADENEILTKSLTPAFLMWRQFEVLEHLGKDLSTGESNTVYMLPYQTMSPDMMQTTMLRGEK